MGEGRMRGIRIHPYGGPGLEPPSRPPSVGFPEASQREIDPTSERSFLSGT